MIEQYEAATGARRHIPRAGSPRRTGTERALPGLKPGGARHALRWLTAPLAYYRVIAEAFEQQLLHARYDTDRRAQGEQARSEEQAMQVERARDEFMALVLRVTGRSR